jgi:hypothetical protein
MKNILYILAVLLIIGCGSSSQITSDNQKQSSKKTWYKPKRSVTWQWQLQGKINTNYDVKIYDIDLFDTNRSVIKALHDSGKKVICYFSGGSYENWRVDNSDFPEIIMGSKLDDWEGEKWLDIRSEKLYSIMKARLDLAVEKGCDGVEPDNMDGYLNDTGFDLTANDQLKYNKFIADEAHKRGLSVGLKNDLNQIEELVEYFDFAVNEQCHQYQECEIYKPFLDANKSVLNAEYAQKYVDNKSDICKESINLGLSTLILPLLLDDSFRFNCK